MNRVYLKVEGSTGSFFESAPKTMTPEAAVAAGYVETKTSNPQTNEIVTSYRKYTKEGVYGQLKGISKKENEFQGRKIMSIQVVMQRDDTVYFLDFPLVDQKGGIQSFAQALITYMPYLVAEKKYRIFPYVIEPKKADDRKKYGVNIKFARWSPDIAVDDTNLVQRLSFSYEQTNPETGQREVVPGDVPKIDWVSNPLDPTKNTANKDKQTAYLVGVLNDHTIAYGGGSTVNTFNSMEEAEASASTPANTSGVAQENIPTTTAPAATAAASTPAAGTASAPAATTNVPEATVVEDDEEPLPF